MTQVVFMCIPYANIAMPVQYVHLWVSIEHPNLFSLYGDAAGSDKILLLYRLYLRLLIPPLKN